MVDQRMSKDAYYLNMAKGVLERSTCLRRKYGAVIVKDDQVVSTGYNGAPRGRLNCNQLGYCYRAAHKIPSGERYELCRSVHAEANAIIAAARADMIGATLYLYGVDATTGIDLETTDCCSMCKRMIINAGISRVIFSSDTGMREINVDTWIKIDDSLPEMEFEKRDL